MVIKHQNQLEKMVKAISLSGAQGVQIVTTGSAGAPALLGKMGLLWGSPGMLQMSTGAPWGRANHRRRC
jgi:hypothetical protein